MGHTSVNKKEQNCITNIIIQYGNMYIIIHTWLDITQFQILWNNRDDIT